MSATNDTTIPYGYCHCGCGQKTKVSESTSKRNGWIKGQPRRFISGHNLVSGLDKTLAVRFWEKIDKRGPAECWLWKTGLRNGYGTFQIDGREQYAHRIAYEFTYGPIPTGLDACHKCDNPACCNPDHIFLGTHQENMNDRNQKGRDKGPQFVPYGENYPTHKLSNADVALIRQFHATGGWTQTRLAERFGVDQSLISRIVHGKDRRRG